MTNVVVLIGRIGKDLELKKTPSGKSFINFSLAVNKFSKGEGKDVDWINCQAWNQTAEFMNMYCNKGDRVAVDGRIQTRNYENNQGQRVYITEVIADRIELLHKSIKQENQEVQEEPKEVNIYGQFQESGIDLNSDDLPF